MAQVTLDFSKGANNRSPANRLPSGFVRGATNVIARADGSLSISPGAELKHAGDVRGAHWFAGQLIIADEYGLARMNEDASGYEQLTVGAFNSICAADVGSLLYLQAGSKRMLYDGLSIVDVPRKPEPPSVSTISGGMRAGRYKVCTVSVSILGGSQAGREIRSAPSYPSYIDLEDGQGIAVMAHGIIFVSQPNGSELYHQCSASGQIELTSARYDTEPLDGAGLVMFPICSGLCSVGSQIAGFSGQSVFYSVPFFPWLHDPVSGVLSFPSKVESIAGDGRTLYVSADKLYEVTGIDTDTPSMSVAHNRKVFGLTAMLDGGVFGMTDFGPIILPGSKLPASEAWASRHSSAKGSVVECDGDRVLLIATEEAGINRSQSIETRPNNG